MSMSFNQFTVVGRVGNHIEPKQVLCKDGITRTVTTFSLVFDRPKSDVPNVILIETWSPGAQWLRKGRLVLVNGEMETWVSENSRGVNFKASNFTLLDKKPQGEDQTTPVDYAENVDDIPA